MNHMKELFGRCIPQKLSLSADKEQMTEYKGRYSFAQEAPRNSC